MTNIIQVTDFQYIGKFIGNIDGIIAPLKLQVYISESVGIIQYKLTRSLNISSEVNLSELSLRKPLPDSTFPYKKVVGTMVDMGVIIDKTCIMSDIKKLLTENSNFKIESEVLYF